MLLTTIATALILQASPAEMLVENALQVSTAQGSYTTYFNADGTYTTDVGIEGTWEVQGDEVCVERSTGEQGCAPIQENLEVGASWEGENAATGETVTYTIVARD
jgi:hypothetical protein